MLPLPPLYPAFPNSLHFQNCAPIFSEAFPALKKRKIFVGREWDEEKMVYPPHASPSSYHLFCFWPTHSVTISSSPHSSPSLEIQNGGLISCKGHTEHVTTNNSLHCRLSIPLYMASVLIKPKWIEVFKQDPFWTKSIFFLFMIPMTVFSIIFFPFAHSGC